MKTILGLALAATVVSTTAASAAELKQIWRLEGLADPESVAPSADGSFYYVSNVNGEGDVKDGNGFIARISRDGKLLQREWATGLNGPKGLTLKGGRLFVSDIDVVVEIDAASGKVLKRHAVDGAKFLNDTALAPDGTVLVTDSGTGRIHALAGGKVSLWLEDPKFRAINGLLPERDRLLVTTMGGLLLAVDWKTKAVTQLAEGLGNGDGIAPLGGGAYLVSEWPGRMFEVAADGSHRVVMDSRQSETYLNDFVRVGDALIVANWKPGTVTAYTITP